MSHYRDIAFRDGDPALDEWGWDIVSESVSETCYTMDDYRQAWRNYRDKAIASEGDAKRFYCWAMCYVENLISHKRDMSRRYPPR